MKTITLEKLSWKEGKFFNENEEEVQVQVIGIPHTYYSESSVFVLVSCFNEKIFITQLLEKEGPFYRECNAYLVGTNKCFSIGEIRSGFHFAVSFFKII